MKKIIDMLKSMTNSKKKVFALALSVCVVVLSIASSSIAYFTDTAEYTNTFTSGNVSITLTEAVAERNTLGNVVKDTSKSRIAYNDDVVYGKIFPTQTIDKDPLITLDSTSENAYVGAIVTLNKTGIGNILKNETDVKNFITGLPTSGATVKVSITADAITIYIVHETALVPNGTAQVFTGLKMFDTWTSTEMSALAGLQLHVKAYAVQKDGFADATTALKTAFTGAFNNMPTT